MKDARRLSLTREALTPLDRAELDGIAGAKVPTFPVNECLGISWEFTCLECLTDARPVATVRNC